MKSFGLIVVISFALLFQTKGQGVPFTNYRVNNSSCQAMTYMTGSRIQIPEDAFENPNNKPVNIKYRELYSKADIILSGISMKLNGGRTLVTGGMFEIYAEINDVPTKLKKGKKNSN